MIAGGTVAISELPPRLPQAAEPHGGRPLSPCPLGLITNPFPVLLSSRARINGARTSQVPPAPPAGALTPSPGGEPLCGEGTSHPCWGLSTAESDPSGSVGGSAPHLGGKGCPPSRPNAGTVSARGWAGSLVGFGGVSAPCQEPDESLTPPGHPLALSCPVSGMRAERLGAFGGLH